MISTKILNKCVKLSRKLIDLPDSCQLHFSFLILKNRIISVGYNLSFKTHPLAKLYHHRFCSIHSELKCINNCLPKYIHRCTLINVRIMKDGSLGMAKPCPKCEQLIRDFGIKDICYTNRNGIFVHEKI